MTNAGKTYTIQGTPENPGILPKLLSELLEIMTGKNNWELNISMLEIYQEKIYDLLSNKKEKLSIRDGNGKVEVSKLSYHQVNSTEESIKLMDMASSKRFLLLFFLFFFILIL
jgi:hypothetical protein